MSLRSIFLFFASIKLAVFNILGLAAVLAYATVMESLHGMRAAKVMVYGTWWFSGMLFLLALNVLCAALSRYPWKKRQMGFVITHAGIIIILIGSFMTQRWGIDGNLPVVEQKQANSVILHDLFLTVSEARNGVVRRFPIPETALSKQGELMKIELTPRANLIVDHFMPRATFRSKVVKSPYPGIGPSAIQVGITNSRFDIEQWLTLDNPDSPKELSLGPAILSFEKLWNKKEERAFLSKKGPKRRQPKIGTLIAKFEGREYRFDLNKILERWIPLGATSIEIKITDYLPYAIVENNELVNKSAEPVNPAVRIDLRSKRGPNEKHTVFANFPQFPTLHKKFTKGKALDINFRMLAADSPRQNLSGVGTQRGRLLLAQSADNKRLLYRALARDGKVNDKGEIKVGESKETGWMDIRFKILNWYPHSVERIRPTAVDYITGSNQYPSALHYRVVATKEAAQPNHEGWLSEGFTRAHTIDGRRYTIRFGKKEVALPFDVFLKKFTIGNDPGSKKAASFESDVIAKDSARDINHEAKISMNEPLDYAGFTLYQASYQLRDNEPPISVFSVNQDPGRFTKYAGSIILVLGIILMFYMNPQYMDKIFGRKREK